jgi:rhodanese-related sulfurtransferase
VPRQKVLEFYNPRPRTTLHLPVKFILDTWYLFLAAAVSGGLLLWQSFGKNAGGSSKVSTSDAVQLINREKAVLIDVSEPEEFAAGHAAGSRSVPLGSLQATNDLPKNKALPLVVMCANGSRAARAVATLKSLGFQNVRPLAGGLAAWREANLPVEKAA